MILRELLKLTEQKVFATGKNGAPSKCFREVTSPSLPKDTIIGYGSVSDGTETVTHVFLLDDNGDIQEPTMMKGQTGFAKGAPITHLKYKVLGTIKLGDLPNDGTDGMQKWKTREIAIAKIANEAAKTT